MADLAPASVAAIATVTATTPATHVTVAGVENVADDGVVTAMTVVVAATATAEAVIATGRVVATAATVKKAAGDLAVAARVATLRIRTLVALVGMTVSVALVASLAVSVRIAVARPLRAASGLLPRPTVVLLLRSLVTSTKPGRGRIARLASRPISRSYWYQKVFNSSCFSLFLNRHSSSQYKLSQSEVQAQIDYRWRNSVSRIYRDGGPKPSSHLPM